ncbi:hypothetical protein ACNI3Q_06760 [Sphingomonas sp. FW199]
MVVEETKAAISNRRPLNPLVIAIPHILLILPGAGLPFVRNAPEIALK